MNRNWLFPTAWLLMLACAVVLPASAQEMDNEEEPIKDDMPLMSTPGMTIGMGYGYGWGQQYGRYSMGHGMNSMHGMMQDEAMAGYQVTLLAQLDLSEDQREEILDIHRELLDDKVDIMHEIRSKADELDEMVWIEADADPDEIKATMVEIAELRADMLNETLQAQREAVEVLEPAQRERLGDRNFFTPRMNRDYRTPREMSRGGTNRQMNRNIDQ